MTTAISAAAVGTELPVSAAPLCGRDTPGAPVAFTPGHHFRLAGDADAAVLAQAATAPLSVIVQVTKRCDFTCGFCSETLQMPDPTLEQIQL